MKIEINELQSILIQNGVDKNAIPSILKDAERAAEEAKADRETGLGKSKYKYLIVAIDPNNEHSGIENIPMYIVKVPETQDHTQVLEKLNKAAYAYNASKKGRKNPVKKVAEIFEYVKAKFFKPDRNPIVTKEPVIVLTTNGEISR